MKKTLFATVLAIAIVFAFSSCGSNKSSKGSGTEQNQALKTIYTCEMHPDVVSDQPGKCPKCGMELVKKEVPATDTTNMKHDTTSSMKNMKI